MYLLHTSASSTFARPYSTPTPQTQAYLPTILCPRCNLQATLRVYLPAFKQSEISDGGRREACRWRLHRMCVSRIGISPGQIGPTIIVNQQPSSRCPPDSIHLTGVPPLVPQRPISLHLQSEKSVEKATSNRTTTTTVTHQASCSVWPCGDGIASSSDFRGVHRPPCLHHHHHRLQEMKFLT